MNTRLVSLDYRVPQCDMNLDNLPVTIGQAADADIRLDDPSVSRYHCYIDRIDDAMVVRDLGSRHGTRINGTLVNEAVLLPGDEITIGMLSFLVQSLRNSTRSPRRTDREAAYTAMLS